MRLVSITLVLLMLIPLVAALSPPSQPTAPSALQSATAGEIDLSWSPPTSSGASPVAGYRIYRSLSSSALSHLVDVGNILAFTDAGLTDGAPRFYRFSAVNGDGEGPLSSVVTASAIAPPTIPRSIFTTASGRGNLTFTWQVPLYNGSYNVTGYNIYRGLDEAGPFGLLGTTATRIYNDTGNGDNETFWYRFSASNAIGESPLTDPEAHRTATTPSTPPNLTVAFLPAFGVSVEWEHPYDDGGIPLQGYRVYRAVGAQVEKVVAVTLPMSPSFTDRKCPLLETCTYRVRAFNVIGHSGFSNAASGTGDDLPIG